MNSSKIILVFCAFAIFSVLAEELDQRLKGALENCTKKLGVDFADLDKFNKGELAQDEKWKCFRACAMKGLGLMKEDGTINKDNIPNTVHINIATALHNCGEKAEGMNECDFANKFNQCAKEKKLPGSL